VAFSAVLWGPFDFAPGKPLVFAQGQPAGSAQGRPADQPEQPRFRAGANLVRVDAYVSLNGEAVTNLTADDFEVLEDGTPQRVESFEFIRARGPVPESARVEPSSLGESRAMAADPNARVFVLFLDVRHVHMEGSIAAKNPMINTLDRVIGQDDLIGVMTPDMSARNITLSRRRTTIEGMLRGIWGERQRLNTTDPRERELELCYPDVPGKTDGIAQELIDRRRERMTLDAIQDLIIYLEGIREDRKFVILLSEGWRLPRRDDRLTRMVNGVPGIEGLRAGPEGRPTNQPNMGSQGFDSCERERMRLASEDLETDFRTLLQRANRANVSFYTVDPRGLAVFDEDLSLRRATNITADRARLDNRQNSLRELAENTDGVAVVNNNNLEAAMTRMLADVGSYYLLGYYSSNTRLDGKYRKLTVRVKRPGADVRARPGYLAPTEEEMAAAREAASGPKPGSDMPPELKRALDNLAPARANVPLRVQTAASTGQLWVTAELDAATLKSAEWQQGGKLRMVVEHERGASPPIEREVTLEPGQRTLRLAEGGSPALAPGRYVVRLSLTPSGGSLPLQSTADVMVPEATALVGSGLPSRRGPATGLQYFATADARFQRTERVRFELPKLSEQGTVSARLLNRTGQQLPLTIALSERVDEKLQTRLIVADLTLAPLAQGEYVLEVMVEKDGKKDIATYGFRVVP
jgi:VWFA-related protein